MTENIPDIENIGIIERKMKIHVPESLLSWSSLNIKVKKKNNQNHIHLCGVNTWFI